jgi:3-methyladenine DNA glycosylase AlkD
MPVRMRDIFSLARKFIDLPLDDIDQLLQRPEHHQRVGALSIMGKQFNRKSTTEAQRADLYELYLRRTNRINTWDLVDLSGHHVVGGYLFNKPRTVLYELASSSDWWERRLAIFATLYFVRRGEVEDTFAIAELLIHDHEDYVNKAVGGLLREAGKSDRARLIDFLDRHAATAPRITLRYAIERLDPPLRQHYLTLHKGQ